MSSFGKVTPIPTSTPTSTRMAMKNSRMVLSFSNENVRAKETLPASFTGSLFTGDNHSQRVASSVMAA